METAEIGVQERRRVRRTRVLKDAKVIFDQQTLTVDCVVRNLTNLGGCLHVPGATGFPVAFELTFDDGRSGRKCRVIWRLADTTGVVFE